MAKILPVPEQAALPRTGGATPPTGALICVGTVEEILPSLAADSFDGVLTDPPYGLAVERWDDPGRRRAYKPRSAAGYGNKGGMRGYGRGGTPQDREAFRRRSNLEYHEQTRAWACLVLRVCKPGSWLIAFGAPRTKHRLAAGIEDGGWEIRDSIVWAHERGVPKNSASDLAPEHDEIVLARKPLSESTIAKNVARWGVGDLRTIGESYPSNHIFERRANPGERAESGHTHVKPVRLCMRLAALILPSAGGSLLVPFCGSGSELVGAARAGWTGAVGIEKDSAHAMTARSRTTPWERNG